MHVDRTDLVPVRPRGSTGKHAAYVEPQGPDEMREPEPEMPGVVDPLSGHRVLHPPARAPTSSPSPDATMHAVAQRNPWVWLFAQIFSRAGYAYTAHEFANLARDGVISGSVAAPCMLALVGGVELVLALRGGKRGGALIAPVVLLLLSLPAPAIAASLGY